MNLLKKYLPAILSLPLFFMACNGADLQDVKGDSTVTSTTLIDTSKRSNNEEMATISSDGVSTDSRQFINEMENKLSLNISFSRAAMDQSTNEGIKNLGKTVADQQTKLLTKLKDLAETKNINFTTDQTAAQDALTGLTSKKGNDFNATYLDRIITDSEATINWLESQANNMSDEQLVQYASSAISIFKQHHDAAKAINDKL